MGHAQRRGVRLLRSSDGQEVALKLYPDDYERVDVLMACRQVQAVVAGRGLPAPRPLVLSETRRGLVAIDTYVGGEVRECRDGPRRRALSAALAEVVSACPSPGEVDALRSSRLATHPGRFAIEEGASSEVAALVHDLRPAVQRAPRDAVVHLDWRTQNVAWRADKITAIYDWDSVSITSEAIAVGCAAGMFSYDFRDAVPHVPTANEVLAFIEDYPRSIDHGVARAAAGLKMLGYAETERRLDPAGTRLGPRSYRSALAASFDAYRAAFQV